MCATWSNEWERFSGKTREIGHPRNNCDDCTRSNDRSIRLTILQHWLLVLWISNCPARRHRPLFTQQRAIVRNQWPLRRPQEIHVNDLALTTDLFSELHFPSFCGLKNFFLMYYLSFNEINSSSLYKHLNIILFANRNNLAKMKEV